VIANLNTNLPGFGADAGFTLGNSTEFLPQSDGQHFSFWARNTMTGAVWLYVVNLDGTGLTELAGPNIQVSLPGMCQGPVNTFLQPRVNGSNVALLGSTNSGIGPFLYITGLTGFPTGPLCSPNGYLTYPPILQYNTPLPGEPPTVQFFYARSLPSTTWEFISAPRAAMAQALALTGCTRRIWMAAGWRPF
jgi:hypothetical protein